LPNINSRFFLLYSSNLQQCIAFTKCISQGQLACGSKRGQPWGWGGGDARPVPRRPLQHRVQAPTPGALLLHRLHLLGLLPTRGPLLLLRMSSLPTETEEERWRCREMQSQRRLEAHRKCIERQNSMGSTSSYSTQLGQRHSVNR
jgi:hypothetical protein